VVMNYFGCMGGGLDDPSTLTRHTSSTGVNCTCGTATAVGLALEEFVHWTNGFLNGNSSRGIRDATDGSSNSILLGETIYQNLQLVRGWGSAWRMASTSNNQPCNVAGTFRAINSGKAIWDAYSNKMSDENLPNLLMNQVFGSQHVGGAHFAF